jgi:hypothetical protein
VDLGSFAATDYILSLNQLEKNYIDREMFAPNDLSAHFSHEEQSEKSQEDPARSITNSIMYGTKTS